MIFERRAYTLRPGRMQDFWDAQREWNVSERSASILGPNLSYFGAAANADKVIHLYRFESVEHWKTSYDEYYRVQTPDYFAEVRPLVLQQENVLLVAPPLTELSALWSTDAPTLPGEFELIGVEDRAKLMVVEETLYFSPGALPSFWDAYRHYLGEAGELARRHLMGVLVVLIGKLHQVLTYRCFRTLAETHEYADSQHGSAHWQMFAERCRDLVVDSDYQVLHPSPVREQRSLFELSGGDGRVLVQESANLSSF